ncbi:uncharacterized protein TNCV_2508571 [Trichonephila clavipes]|nr:uncharacterized protein TNCV_2508571 [Trichonephila clavipes]
MCSNYRNSLSPAINLSTEHSLMDTTTVVFCDVSRRVKFSLQSDSRRTLIWRAPGTRYHQENTIEGHRFGGAGWLVFRRNYSWFPELTCMFRV